MPNDGRVIPSNSTFDVINVDLLVDGKPIDPAFQLLSITVHDEVNRICTATVILRDGDPSAETFEASASPTFVPGKKIQVKIGYDSDRQSVFQGVIVRHAIRSKDPVSNYLILECRHAAVKMTLGRRSKYFEAKKDSEIIEDLMGPYGLKGKVEATSVKHKEVVQFRATDWDFMLGRAEMNGRLVLTNGDKIDVKKPDTSAAPVLILTYGGNLLEIDAEIDASTQWKKVKSYAWDYAGQTLFEAEGGSPSFAEAGNLSGNALSAAVGPSEFELRHTGQVLQEELKAWADAAMLKSRMAKIRGRAKITGFNKIKPGSTVELRGCGARFNGKVFVTGVRHEVYSGTWNTHIQFGLSPHWFSQTPDVPEMPAAGLVPAIHGLQIGVTVQIENDPDGEDRLLVRLPVLDPQAKGVWARVCTLDAGKERGTFFRPEIGDEVIVGFLNDDPRDPVVLGMLHSSAHPAWEKGKDDNHIKGFWSRSKMKWVFDDDKKIITVETPAGNQFIISEDAKSITLKDQNGNQMVMNDSGIEIKSIKDIKISASANIEIKAGANLKAEGSANAEVKAGAQLKASGGAAAELSSSGATILKGMPIKIN